MNLKNLNFKQWLQLDETGSFTNSVAHYSLPIGGMVTRNFPQFYSVGDYGLAGPLQNFPHTDYIPKKKKKRKGKH